MSEKLLKLKKRVAVIAAALVGLLSYGQQVTVYNYNFPTSAGTSYTTTNGLIGTNASWNLLTSGTDMGGRINNGYLDLTNDATGATNNAGWVLGYVLNANSTPYNTTLASNPGLVTWTFNMRQSRTNPTGMSNNGYGNAFVLAGTSNTTATTGSGYAVMLGNSGNTDPIRLVRYTSGLRTSTDLLSSSTSGVNDFGHHYISIKVTYSPTTNTWELFVRKDNSASFSDPATGTLYTQGTVVNSGSTATALPLMGGFWNAGTKKGQTAYFDNIKVTVATPVLSSISPTSKVAGSAAFTLTVTGSNFTSASVINWNGLALTTAYGSATQLTATVPAANVASAGTATITVGTGAATSNSQPFYIDAAGVPSISTSTSALNNFLTTTGTASAAQSFTSSGTSLQSGTITITAPTNFEISSSAAGTYSSSLNITGSLTTTYVRVAASAPAGIYSSPVILMSSGATTRQIGATATVLSTEPTTTATSLTFSGVNSIQGTVNWSGGNGANHIVVIRSAAAVSASLTDGTTYLASSTFAGGADAGTQSYVVYAGSANTVMVTGLTPATTYYVNVYEYNGSGGTENYRTTAISGNFTTLNAPLGWQIKAVNTVYTVDFDNSVEGVNNGTYAGAGLDTLPDDGELNSNAFVMSTITTTGVTFGATIADDDPSYGNGTSTGGVTDGGFYAFQVGTGNYALGLQPDATYPSGSTTLRFQNQTGVAITSLNVAYKVYVRNDEAGNNYYNFSHSAVNATNTSYTAATVLNLTTTATADAIPGWKMYYKVVTLTGLSIASNSYYYIRWSGDVLTGSAYDEIALDDITVVANPTSAYAPVAGNIETAVLAGNASLNGTATVNTDITFNGGKLYLGANTLNLNGTVTNTTTAGLSGGNSANLIVGGSISPTISFDQTTAGTTNLLNNLTITPSGTNTVTLGNNLVVNGTLTVDTNQTLALGTNTLTGTLATITNNGTVTTTNTTTTPFASGKTWGGTGTLILNAASAAQYLPAGTYNKVTVNTTGGGNATGDVTLTGDLYLPNANVSSTKGAFDTSSYAVTMGSNSFNTGIGDVSGTVTRNSGITVNIVYTFGHPRTSIIFPTTGTLPTAMSLKTTLGAAPSGKTDAILRNFDLIQTGGTGTKATISAHYLDSELNSNTENNLVDWVVQVSPAQLIEQGRTTYSTTDNYIELSNVNVAFFSTSFGSKFLTLANSQAATVTWNGSVSTSWTTAANWTPNATPSDATNVIIPDAATTFNDPVLNSSVTIGSLNIQSGGIVNAPAAGQLTITKTSGAWINQGTFNPSTSTVTFNAASTGGDVSIAGSTTFYNLTVPTGTNLRPVTDNVINISGTFTKDGNLFASAVTNTIIYSGTNQTVVSPNGAASAYNNLTITGTGAILPTTLNLAGNLTTNQTVNFTGNTTNFIGADAGGQYINGTVSPSFYNLTLNKPTGSGTLILQTNTSVTNTLTLSSGLFDIASYDLTLGTNAVAGTFSATSMIDADGTGHVRRPYTGTGSYTFPIGETTSNTTYSPITVNVTSGTFSNAYVSVNVTDATHPNNYATDDYLTRYWSVTQTGITNAVATITGSYVTGDAVGGESTLVAAQLNGTFNVTSNPWIRYSTLGSTTLTATGATLTAGQTSYFTGIKGGAISVAVTGGGTFCQNTYVELSSTVSGGVGNYSYSWSNSLGNGTTAVPPTSTVGSTVYTLTVTDANGATGTASGTITVTSAPVAGTLSSNQSICANTTPAAITLTGYTGTIVRWERSTSTTFPNPTFIASTNATLTGAEIGTTLTTTRYLRAVVQNGSCDVVYSNYVEVKINTTTWDGTAWNNGTPTATDAVVFNADYTANGNLNACTIVVNSGANVVIPTGYTVTVNGAVTVNTGGTFTLNNNAALLQLTSATNSGAITLHKLSNPLFRLDYTMWSSPVDNLTLYDFSPATVSTRFYEYKYDYDPSVGYNINAYWPVSSSDTFTTAKGYLIRMPNTISADVTGSTNDNVTTPTEYSAGTDNYYFDGVFTGTPHNGTITYDLSVQGNRFTAVGNPYPSPINLSDFFTTNNSAIDISSGIYLWRKRNNSANSSYAVLSQGGYAVNPAEGGGSEQGVFYSTGSYTNWLISQGQGFFVKTLPSLTSASLSFTNSMRRPSPGASQGFFKSASNSVSRVWLNMAAENGTTSQTLITYLNEGTLGLDYGFDAKSFAEGSSLAFYSIAENTPLTIQVRPTFESSDVVHMGYTAPMVGTFTVSLDHFQGVFDEGQKVYIRDNNEGIVRDLTENTYTFTTEAGTFEGRFDVIYTTNALGVDNPASETSNVIVYSEGKTIGINSGNTLMNNVTIYDIRGRKLYSQEKVNATQLTISNLVAEQQVLIVEIDTAKGKVTKRIVF
ncbi:T9SS sorting signal type C domain-containing protein [Flavobacterium sp. RHBU_3]|uniref:T9SS sorting signal type C domain-containing protein n=1 Tax=Flavobacterium sp. RHBU_3 TaxID=3391184 RepID=UPI003984F899